VATVQITVPDALIPRLTAALRDAYPQHDALGVSAAFKAATADHWRDVLTTYERRVAENTAAIKAAADKAATDAAGIG